MAWIKYSYLVMVMAIVVGGLVVGPKSEAAVSCGTVTSGLVPCVPYLSGQSSSPSAGCCAGIKGLASARTTADRRTICNCLKSLAINYKPYLAKAAGLPAACRVNIPYKISPSTDCNKLP